MPNESVKYSSKTTAKAKALITFLFAGIVGYLAMAATPNRPILRLVVLYDEQLPPDDQRVHEASTRLPKINSPGTSANRQMNIS